MQKHLTVILFLLFSTKTYSQILWVVESDSVELNPTEVTEQANILILKEKISGSTIFNFENKEIYFRDRNGLYRLDKGDIEEINAVFGLFTSTDLFKEKSIEDIRSYYREKLYPKLNLNKINFSISRNAKYLIKDGALIIKNEKSIEGKICGINPYKIIILDAMGKLIEVTDRDIVYIDFLGSRFFRTAELYYEFYKNYDIQLNSTINTWEKKYLSKSIESIIDSEGPYDRVLDVNNKKFYIWEKEYQVYNVNLGSNTQTSSLSNSNGNVSGNSYIYGTGIQSINSYGDKNSRSGFLSSTSSISKLYLSNYTLNRQNLSFSSSVTNLKGQVTSKTDIVMIAIKVDGEKITNVYHENIFSFPYFGMEFKFINY